MFIHILQVTDPTNHSFYITSNPTKSHFRWSFWEGSFLRLTYRDYLWQQCQFISHLCFCRKQNNILKPANLPYSKLMFSSLNFFRGRNAFQTVPSSGHHSTHTGSTGRSAGCRQPRCSALHHPVQWRSRSRQPFATCCRFCPHRKIQHPSSLPSLFIFFCLLMLPCMFWVQTVSKNATLILIQLHQEWNRPEILCLSVNLCSEPLNS